MEIGDGPPSTLGLYSQSVRRSRARRSFPAHTILGWTKQARPENRSVGTSSSILSFLVVLHAVYWVSSNI